MEIDARGQDIQDLLRRLKEVLSTVCGSEIAIDILLDTTEEARKISSFVSMSGCKAEIDRIDDHYIMRVTGFPCCT